MAKTKDKTPPEPSPSSRPAIDPDARLNQLISLAVDCAEKQLRDGTASSQEKRIKHFKRKEGLYLWIF